MIEHEHHEDSRCCVCGERVKQSTYLPDDDGSIVCSSQCFAAKYWLDRVYNKSNNKQVIINGYCYQIGRNDAPKYERGFDGKLFIIYRFSDHAIIKTHNLWSNGQIPIAFRKLLPDNAKFIAQDDICNHCNQYYEDCACSDFE